MAQRRRCKPFHHVFEPIRIDGEHYQEICKRCTKTGEILKYQNLELLDGVFDQTILKESI